MGVVVVLTWLLCCRWAGSPWATGGNPSLGEPLDVNAWPCDLGILRWLGALLCLALPSSNVGISLQLVKWKVLDWNQEWWQPSFVPLLLHVPACLDRPQACPWIPVVLICPALCLSLKTKNVIIAYVLVASSVGEWKACCSVWYACLEEAVWTDAC